MVVNSGGQNGDSRHRLAGRREGVCDRVNMVEVRNQGWVPGSAVIG